MTSPVDIRLPQRHIEHCMGTVFSFDIRSPGVDHADLKTVLDWLHWADQTFSTYQPNSQINRLNRDDVSVLDCAPEVREILKRCAELEDETDGYFSTQASGCLDPSGLVKGWAIQRASDMLRNVGSTNHCVNGGGDVQCIGSPQPETPWRIGIAHPLRPDHLAGTATGHHLAVATSGSAERGAHIINPRSTTSPDVVASVTLVGRDLATTDAYATAAFAMGTDAPAWIDTLPNYQGLVVFADGTQWCSPTLDSHH
ncbi:MAG: FAD:protein FMN transferase [Jatrophihabitantaceae bacterium]